MPTTINGIGTTYYGKKKLEQYQGVCEFCNNATTLSDYETGHFFCLIFIPIIPLGRKMILGECGSCTRHRAISVKEWERVKEDSISEGVASLNADSEDPAKAIELLGTYTAFKQYDVAKDLAAAISSNHSDNYDAQLSIGSWYEQIQMKTEADECFDRCLELDYDRPSSVNIRCVTHLEKGELSEGRKLALQLFEADKDYAGIVFHLANAYQQAEQPADAYEMYQLLFEAIPDLAEDKELCREVRKLESTLGVTTSIAPRKGFFGLFG